MSKAEQARLKRLYRTLPDMVLYGWEPQTSEDGFNICGFPVRQDEGTVCREEAGAGTLHEGIGYCYFHRIAAARSEGTLLADIFRGQHIDPEDALERQLAQSQSAVSILTTLISEMPLQALESTAEGRVAMRLLREERDRITKTAVKMIDMDFRERQTGLAEKLSAPIVAVLEGVLSDLRLDRHQQAAVGPIVRKHLALLEGGRLPAPSAPIDVEATVEDDGEGEDSATG